MRFRVASFNTNNLVLPNVEFYGNLHYSKQLYEKKIDWIASQLLEMDSDIVGFQEVFHQDALKDAVKRSGRYPKSDIFAPYTQDEELQPNCAILSRFPAHGFERIVDFPKEAIISYHDQNLPVNSFRHPVVKALIELPDGHETAVFVAHLKSKRPHSEGVPIHDEMHFAVSKSRSLLLRMAEATALRALVLRERKQGRPVIVMGDLNDSVNSVTTRLISGEDPLFHLPLKAKKRVWDSLLYSTYDIQQRQSDRDVYYTHIHNGKHESLDHILVSEEFYHRNPQRFAQVRYMRLYNDHVVDMTLSENSAPRWKTDHGQVMVSIQMRKDS